MATEQNKDTTRGHDGRENESSERGRRDSDSRRGAEDRRPPYLVKHYVDKEDRHGVVIGAAWKVGTDGWAIVLRDGLSITGGIGRVVMWPRE